MNQAIFTAKSGIRSQQTRLDVIGNNLANVNTVGFKTVRVDFKDAIYQTLRRPVQPQDELNLELGHGTLVGATYRDFRVGQVQVTNNITDIMLTGDGYFAVETASGETQYTRNGALALSNEEDGLYLVTGYGAYVLDTNGERIAIPGSSTELVIDQQGLVSNGSEDPPVAQIAVYRFDNMPGLQAVGESNFIPSVISGEPKLVSGEDIVRQGAIEMSNVELANEMTRMIRTQRAFQLSSRALTTADQMIGLAVNMRRS